MLRSVSRLAFVCVVLPVAAAGQVPATAPADDARVAEPAIPIILVKKPVHDFGTVWVGDLLHTFVVHNVGSADLRILKVRPACGCTVVGKRPEVIPPGQSGEIPLRLSSERYVGRFSTTITVQTNDPAHTETRLTLKCFVKHYVLVSPRAAYFRNVKPDSVLTSKLTLTNNTNAPMKPSISQERKSETFKGQLVEVEAGQKYELIVTASPPYQTKYNRFLMEIDAGIPQAPTLKIICTAILPKRLDVAPEAIYVTPGRTMSPRRLTFTNNGDRPVKLLSATPLDERLNVTVTEKVEAKEYSILVSLPSGYLPPPAGTSIVLKTDDSDVPQLRIPVRRTRTAQGTTARPPVRRMPPRKSALLGKAAPQVTCTTYDNKEAKIGGDSGKVQLLTFYASWCGFCRRAMPSVEKLHQRYGNRGVDVIAINVDGRTGRVARTQQQTLELYKQLKLSMPMTMDPEQKIAKQFKVGPVPAFFLVGKNGIIEAAQTGYPAVTGSDMPAKLDLLLQGKTRADFPEADRPAASRPASGS